MTLGKSLIAEQDSFEAIASKCDTAVNNVL